jgi:hypothetical protein
MHPFSRTIQATPLFLTHHPSHERASFMVTAPWEVVRTHKLPRAPTNNQAGRPPHIQAQTDGSSYPRALHRAGSYANKREKAPAIASSDRDIQKGTRDLLLRACLQVGSPSLAALGNGIVVLGTVSAVRRIAHAVLACHCLLCPTR